MKRNPIFFNNYSNFSQCKGWTSIKQNTEDKKILKTRKIEILSLNPPKQWKLMESALAKIAAFNWHLNCSASAKLKLNKKYHIWRITRGKRRWNENNYYFIWGILKFYLCQEAERNPENTEVEIEFRFDFDFFQKIMPVSGFCMPYRVSLVTLCAKVKKIILH